MKHYELAYETENEECLIIPHLLKEDRPKTLPDFPVGESLMLRYKADEPLPPHTISRFIVRHHEEIKEKLTDFVWRFGVLLEDGEGNIALVQEKNRIISVFVKGKNKTNYISQLRETLNGIFDSYKNKNPELQYRIVDPFGQTSNEVGVKDLWLQDEIIVKHYEKKKTYWDAHTDQDIPMDGIVNIYNIKCENIILGGQKPKIIQNQPIKGTKNGISILKNIAKRYNDIAQRLGLPQVPKFFLKNDDK